MENPVIAVFPDPNTVAQQFGHFLREQINAQETFHLALSGGSTPKLLFDWLAQQPEDWINWKRVHLYWGDERCVPPTNDESNFKMTKEHLLDFIPIPGHQVHRVLGEDDPDGEAIRYGQEIVENVPMDQGKPRFDLIMLGMGADGHTASIFPHQMELLHSDAVCAVATHPESGQRRVTLTGEVINAATHVAFLVTGASKKEKVEAILHQTNDYQQYPAAHIQPGNGTLHWFLDEAAS